MTVKTIIAGLALAAAGMALGGCHEYGHYHDRDRVRGPAARPLAPDPAPVTGTWGIAGRLQATLRHQLASHRARVDELQPKLDRRQARVDRLLAGRREARRLRSAALERSRQTVSCGLLHTLRDALVEVLTLSLARTRGSCAADGAAQARRAAVRHGERISMLTDRLVTARGRLVTTRRAVEREQRAIEVARAKTRAASGVRGTGVTCELRGGMGSANLELHNDNGVTVTAVVRVPRVGIGPAAAHEEVTLAAGEHRALRLFTGVVSDPASWMLSASDCAPRLVDLRLPDRQAVAPHTPTPDSLAPPRA